MKLPQLSLRDLFWLVALVAMGCGWWVERWHGALSRQQRDRQRYLLESLVNELNQEGLEVRLTESDVFIGGYNGFGFGNGKSAFNSAKQSGERP